MKIFIKLKINKRGDLNKILEGGRGSGKNPKIGVPPPSCITHPTVACIRCVYRIQTSEMELLVKTVIGFKPLTIFV